MIHAIAIVIESLGGGGAQHVASTLANAWSAEGRAVTVITLLDTNSDVFLLDSTIERRVIFGAGQSNNLLAAVVGNIRRIYMLRRALKRCSAPLVLSFVGSTNILTVIAALGLNKRVVISERNDPSRQSLGFAWDLLRRVLYGRADLVVANSRAAIEAMKAYVPAKRLIWLPNPLRTAPPETDFRVPISEPFFLSAGRLEQQKALDLVLEAFAKVSRILVEWKLVVLGDGTLREELIARAKKLGLLNRIYFAGYVRNPFPWYRNAEVFVHPARYEGLPNTVLEAMSEARSVITTDTQTGLSEFVRQGETGLVIPADSISALAEAMLLLGTNSDLRSRIGAAAREAVAPCRADYAIEKWSMAIFDMGRQ